MIDLKTLSNEDLLKLNDDVVYSYTNDYYEFAMPEERRQIIDSVDLEKVQEEILLRMNKND